MDDVVENANSTLWEYCNGGWVNTGLLQTREETSVCMVLIHVLKWHAVLNWKKTKQILTQTFRY